MLSSEREGDLEETFELLRFFDHRHRGLYMSLSPLIFLGCTTPDTGFSFIMVDVDRGTTIGLVTQGGVERNRLSHRRF